MKREKQKKSKARRVLRAVCLLLVALLAYNIVGGVVPFLRLPEVADTAAIEARADAMQQDVETTERAMLLKTHEEALDERMRLLDRAQWEIVIAVYDCRDGESTRDVLCVALARADAGVKVRLLVDGIAGVLNLALNPLFRAFAGHPNVELRLYNPPKPFMPWQHMGRMHDKYIIVDDTAFILGGRNMFDSFIGGYMKDTRKDDREVLVYDPEGDGVKGGMGELRNYFEGMWAGAAGYIGMGLGAKSREREFEALRARYAALKADRPELFDGRDYAEVTLPTRGVWLISNPTTVYAKQPTGFALLTALMERAKASVFIQSPYAVLNGPMRRRLTQIAQEVPVTLMVNAVERSHNVVSSGDYLFHKPEVLSTGAAVYEYAGANYHHGKAMAIDDDLSVIGSFNLDIRSAYVDTELMLVLRGEGFGRQVRDSLEALRANARRALDDGTYETPAGLVVPPLPFWKEAALRVLGFILQPVRNLL